MRLYFAPRRHGANERWLVSYADFVTLLFAFFVVLYAHSQTDGQQTKQLAASFRAAMGDDELQRTLAQLMGTPGSKPKLEPPSGNLPATTGDAPDTPKGMELLPSMKELNKTLEKEIESGKMEVRLERRGLIISLREAGIFPSGDSTILPATKHSLGLVAQCLRPLPNPVRLEGHTDAVPIHNSRFRSNWELSAARSIALMELFTSEFGITRDRISVAGFAETAPVATNATDEGRARNRRVDVVVLTAEGAISQPTAYQAPGR
jgi:chemotaxis protein MotB